MKTDTGIVQDRFLEFLKVWCSRDSQTLAKFKSFIDDEFTGFGSAKHEIFRNSQDLFEQTKKEISQIPYPIDPDIKWIEEVKLDSNTSLINCEIRFTFKLNERPIEFGPLRITFVWFRRNNSYKIASLHASLPDIASEAEVFPGSIKPTNYEEISVVFTDFVGFTNIASSIPAKKLVDELNDIFMKFDEITNKKGLDKIKTIGDSYMAVAGLNNSNNNHAVQCVNWAKEVIKYLRKRNEHKGIKWDIRIGIHTGSAVGGIIGKIKKTFDLWGDTINIANRIEKESLINKINISAYTYEQIRDKYDCKYRGKIDIKGKGSLDMYFVG
jgi:class 3 adenylate cyclase